MKTINIIKIVAVFLFVGVFTACVQDDDYSVPTDLGVTENLNLTAMLNDPSFSVKTIQEVKDFYVNDEVHSITSNIYVKGYVSSSDEAGNFYKEFFIQDDPINPTAAIKVMINASDIFGKYNLGREVYINLKDLHIGESRNGDGVTAIGGVINADGDEVEEITENRANVQVLRSDVTMTITPLEVTFSQVSNQHIGMLVSVNNVQFPTSDIANGFSYVSPYDDFDTQRTMESCEGFGFTSFKLETSTFANFKDVSLPAGGGTISGVITKTYDGSDMVMALNSVDDVSFINARCTPLTAFFDEDFNTAVNNTDLDLTDWTNFAEAGSRVWREKTFSGNGYAELSAFGSGDVSNIAWLVSPGIDMDAQAGEILTFKTAQHHLDDDVDNKLEVFVSTDFDGTNVLTATWVPVVANIATMDNSWYSFVDSGLVDLSSYTGTLYVGFKYTGSGTNTVLDGSYQVEDFKVGSL